MGTFFSGLISFVIVLTIVVFVHEWGHFFMARYYNVPVKVFSIGFGKELFSFKDQKGTKWQVSLIPLGGYVKMEGDEKALENIPPAQKSVIAFAGPAVNFLFSFILLIMLFLTIGRPSFSSEVQFISKDSPAFHSEIKETDQIITINDQPAQSFEIIRKLVKENAGEDIKVKIERKGKQLEKIIQLYKIQDNKKIPLKMMGIGFKMKFEKLSLWSALKNSLTFTYEVCKGILYTISKIFTKEARDNIGGVISIGAMAKSSIESGLYSFVFFIALISINLGFINLLPIPILDGGHVLFGIIECITGHKISLKTQQITILVGGIILFSLMLWAIWNDLIRFKVLQSIIDKLQLGKK